MEKNRTNRPLERINNESVSCTEGINRDRRRSLKKIALGGGMVASMAALPSKWIKPIVDKVILPAHALTSTTTTINPCNDTLTGVADFIAPGKHQFVVPDGVCSVQIEALGAGGGGTVTGNLGGIGGISTGTISVTPGEILMIVVGAQGTPGDFSAGPFTGGQGYGNGGDGGGVYEYVIGDENGGGGGGGGGTAILKGTVPVMIAGGGGGGNSSIRDGTGGGGGGTAGGDGIYYYTSECGKGGIDGYGGEGGHGFLIGANGQHGGPLNGGDGGYSSGGGGGGYGGGGGGGLFYYPPTPPLLYAYEPGPGGGGGGLAGPGGTTTTGGGSTGNGSVVITW